MATISELKTKAVELRKIADKLDAAADALAELGDAPSDNGHSNKVIQVAKDLSRGSGLDAIQFVLKQAGKPVQKDDILHQMSVRGKAISRNTLDVYLSQNKNLFVSHGGGRWGLVEK